MTTRDPRPKNALYEAPRDHAILVDVPEEPFLSVDGHGSPYDPPFQGAIRALYSLAYAIHFDLKQRTGASHPVPPLEALWWWGTDRAFPTKDEKEWRWRLMIRQPVVVTPDDLARAKAATRAKHPEVAVDPVELRRYHEGRSMQILHVGPYKDEATTIQRLHEEIDKAGYHAHGMHHEIYLGDPRRAKPEKLRTLLRQPVAPARA
jgi:hypothetical protein